MWWKEKKSSGVNNDAPQIWFPGQSPGQLTLLSSADNKQRLQTIESMYKLEKIPYITKNELTYKYWRACHKFVIGGRYYPFLLKSGMKWFNLLSSQQR